MIFPNAFEPSISLQATFIDVGESVVALTTEGEAIGSITSIHIRNFQTCMKYQGFATRWYVENIF